MFTAFVQDGAKPPRTYKSALFLEKNALFSTWPPCPYFLFSPLAFCLVSIVFMFAPHMKDQKSNHRVRLAHVHIQLGRDKIMIHSLC